VETAFSGKALRWNKEKIYALIRLMTEKSTIIKRKITPSLTSNDTNISQ
jgi:NH3-dependent NAD+ synthetase